MCSRHKHLAARGTVGEVGRGRTGRESRKHGAVCTALSSPETQYPGVKPDGGEETTPKTVASPLPAHEQGALGSAFQTNRRESFYQRDLEEKMVHKVTMDTVRIITSSVSGMTNVSAPRPLGWHAAAGGSCRLHCPGRGPGARPEFFSHFRGLGCMAPWSSSRLSSHPSGPGSLTGSQSPQMRAQCPAHTRP